MKFKNLYKLYFVLSLLVISIWAIYKIVNVPSCEEYMQRNLSEEYSGIVNKKYIDSLNHLNKTIVIKVTDGSFNIQTFNRDKSGLYNYVKLGDSLSKLLNTYKVDVFRKGEKETFFIDFNCEPKVLK